MAEGNQAKTATAPLVALHFATASWPDDEALLLAVDCAGAHELLPPTLRARLEVELPSPVIATRHSSARTRLRVANEALK